MRDPAGRRPTVRLGVAQLRCDGRPRENLARAIEAIEALATRESASVILLPELFTTEYFCQEIDPARFDLAEAVPGPTTDALAASARRHGVTVVGTLFERRTAGLHHNAAVVIDADGSLAGVYRKMHIPDDPCFHEKYYFAPGDGAFEAVATRHLRIGALVCWDQWYPEAARLSALRGAELLAYPTAIGWLEDETGADGESLRDAWITIQRAHAIANGVFVASVNRVGRQGRVDFWGSSFVCDPFGRVLVSAPRGEEALVVADLDLARIERTRREWPFWRDRRIDAYGGLDARWGAR